MKKEEVRVGRSGARVDVREHYVVKSGGTAVGDQGRYCQMFPDACPLILSVGESHYTMERLVEFHSYLPTPYRLEEVRELLASHFWARPAIYTPFYEWQNELILWASKEHWYDIIDLLQDLYPPSLSDTRSHCCIHGDPTLENTMVRNSGAMVLCDPIPAAGKIPGLPEVDMGKMLQSVVGWEHVARGWRLQENVAAMLNAVVPGVISAELNYRRVMFWLFVHLLRIVPYVSGSEEKLVGWAQKSALVVYEDLLIKEFDPCDTLTTLTELSRIHGTQSSPPTDASE